MNPVEAGKQIALKHILFATDFSPCSDAALPYAVYLARKYGATLHAARVIPTMAGDIVFMSPEGWPTLADEIELQAKQQFTSLEASLKGVRHGLRNEVMREFFLEQRGTFCGCAESELSLRP